MSYAPRLLAPVLITLLVLPVAAWASRGRERLGLGLAAGFFLVSSALQLMPGLVATRWNWQGKLLEGALAVAAVFAWPRMERDEVGLIARVRPGTARVLPLLLLLPAYTALFRFGLGSGAARGSEAMLFQLLVPGPVEELAYRGVLQGFVRRALGPGWAVGLTAVVFGLVHALTSGPRGVAFAPENLDLVLWGLVLGFVRERTGTLWPGMLAHAAANVVTAIP